MLALNTPVENLNKIGQQTAFKLKKLNIFSIQDLLYYFPVRYEDFSQIKNIADLQPGDIATIKGKIELLTNKRSPKKRMIITECFLSDKTGSIKVIWFGQPYIIKSLQNNDEIYLAGKISGNLFELSLQNPVYEKISASATHTARLVPIYSLTAGLSQKQIRFLIKTALTEINKIEDYLPEKIVSDYKLVDLNFAIKQIHFPAENTSLKLAIQRLKFDELLKIQLQNQLLKIELKKSSAEAIKFQEKQTSQIVKKLGFELTTAQKKSAWQILQDMEKNTPMNRLLEGDVGSGKTVVATIAMANTALNDCQCALLAPTEILAGQHYNNLKDILNPIKIKFGLLTAGRKIIFDPKTKQEKKLSKAEFLKQLKNNQIKCVIGTQALIQDKVEFFNLALVIVDEQHRFGVEQRRALKEKSGRPQTTPHWLSMTATPIPRTLAMTLYGNLKLSIINELPPGRKKPITRLVEPEKRDLAYEFILTKIKEGRQAFVICPLIENSDILGVKSATAEYQKLQEHIFPTLKIGLMHGRLKSIEKEKIMTEFSEGKIDILVATSVVEVGVNIPNASVIIIESAERFGLSQLHQFRGRVNRSHHQAYCLLFTDSINEASRQRLNTLVKCYDGFILAEEDLKQRGSGSLTGFKQSGWASDLKLAGLADTEIIQQTQEVSLEIINSFPSLLDQLQIQSYHPE